jgi:DHA2 family multidrug resistance protein
VDLRLFARRNFLVGVAATSVGYMMFFGISIVVPLWLQTQMGYTAAWAGLAVAPVSFFPLVLSRSIARWLQRSDPRLFASGAFLVLAGASFMRAAFTTQVDFSSVVLAQLVTGLGIALFMVPLQSISLSGLRNDQMAGAAGLSSFFRVIGGSFGASLAITLWSRCIGRSFPNRYRRGTRGTSNRSRESRSEARRINRPIRFWSAC